MLVDTLFSRAAKCATGFSLDAKVVATEYDIGKTGFPFLRRAPRGIDPSLITSHQKIRRKRLDHKCFWERENPQMANISSPIVLQQFLQGKTRTESYHPYKSTGKEIVKPMCTTKPQTMDIWKKLFETLVKTISSCSFPS